MKRLGYLVMLMVLSSSAQAGNTFSFVVGGHRVNIDAPRNCRFASCVSLSIPGIYQAHRKRDRDDDTGVAPTPAKQPAPVVAPTQVAPVVTSVKPAATPVCAPPAPQPRSPVSPTLAATTTQPAPAPPPRPEPDKTASRDSPPDEKTPVVDLPIEKPLVEQPPVETPPLAAKPATDAAPVVTKVSQPIESDPQLAARRLADRRQDRDGSYRAMRQSAMRLRPQSRVKRPGRHPGERPRERPRERSGKRQGRCRADQHETEVRHRMVGQHL